MASSSVAIPILSGRAYHQLFFQGEGRSLAPVPSGTTTIEHFEIHRRDDFRYKCKDTIEANRLDFYLVFIVTGGEGIHTFGAETHYVRENMLCFIGPHTITSWQTTVPDHQGYFCAFSEDFFNADRADKGLLRSLPFFRVGGGASTLQLEPAQTRYFLELMQHMEADYQAGAAEHAPLLRAQLQLLLQRAYALYHHASPRAEQRHSAGVQLTNAFLALLDADFARLPLRQTTVAHYADRLHVSPNHLHDMVRAHTGRSAGAVVQALLVRTATAYLVGTAVPVAEVARLLGFASAAYFARFFRRHTGQSPSAVRAGGVVAGLGGFDSVESAGSSVKPTQPPGALSVL
ncbi:helix-turn-helix domain-containing protein [Hymenobacter yonginensis]|uniref:AraC family transcriptional regulator n=1 Tax=Hymenobacter yonginensis TaxID=748197 RepID=A0ABY7PKU1_9BACT|nr:AraC family transcriptional regulator [Hymenobacter yonginensis]WBO83826.1 AraC family transcriptional regulator [Hymenobacter yonginensis]